jgi:hypothetical protein
MTRERAEYRDRGGRQGRGLGGSCQCRVPAGAGILPRAFGDPGFRTRGSRKGTEGCARSGGPAEPCFRRRRTWAYKQPFPVSVPCSSVLAAIPSRLAWPPALRRSRLPSLSTGAEHVRPALSSVFAAASASRPAPIYAGIAVSTGCPLPLGSPP